MQKLWSLPGIVVLVGLFFLVKKGRQERTDPDWTRTEQMLRTNYFRLDEAADSLRLMHQRFHGRALGGDSAAFKIASSPVMPTMEFSKFRSIFEKVAERKKVVLSAVSGVGLTTLSDRLARLIVSRPENLLLINCAPQFDLELHKRCIGETVSGRWRAGELVRFWEKAVARPDEKFVALFDNLDKINPETLFGPELWEKLTDSKQEVVFDGKKVVIPPNFYLISATHLGEGAKIELSNEHFKRLGQQIVIDATADELVISLQLKRRELEKRLADIGRLDGEEKERLDALRDSANCQRFVYFFLKSNKILAEQLDASFQLGWTNFKKLYRPVDFEQMRRQFTSNANGLRPRLPVTEKTFAMADYAICTGGLLQDSNFFARSVEWLRARGFLTEFTVVSLTALVTAIGGWWIFRQRGKRLAKLNTELSETMHLYDNQEITIEQAYARLTDTKQLLHKKVSERKLNFTEANYFLRQVDDEVRRLEIAKQTTAAFLHLVETFLEDNVLTEGEYRKLCQFLDAIRFKIPAAEWQRYRDEVEDIHQKFRSAGG